MAAGLAINVTDWMAWAPGRASRAAWRRWARDGGTPTAAAHHATDAPDEAAGSDLQPLPMMLRRRSGPLGRLAIGTALACDAAARARYVFSSRHGDLARTAGQLAGLAKGEAPSPADFSMSVHHAFAALLSIHTANRQGHSALAAGPDSFGFGFLEAASCALETPELPALLIHCDAEPPAEFAALGIEEGPLVPTVLAIQFGPRDLQGTSHRFAAMPAANRQGAADGEPPAGSTSAALDFLHFLLADLPLCVSHGERMSWRWSRDA